MQQKTRKFLDYVKGQGIEFFDLQSMEDVDILKHDERINGVLIQSAIFIQDDSRCINISFFLANCTNELKQKQIILYLNELNRQQKLKYYLDEEDGSIVASLQYWVDDNSFVSETLFGLYIVFLRSIIDNEEVPKLMRMIWG